MRASVDVLKAMIKELEDKPKDSSYDEEIKELKREEAALLTVLQEIGKRISLISCPMKACFLTTLSLKPVLFFVRFFTVRRTKKHLLKRKNMRRWSMNIAVVHPLLSASLRLTTAFMLMVAS